LFSTHSSFVNWIRLGRTRIHFGAPVVVAKGWFRIEFPMPKRINRIAQQSGKTSPAQLDWLVWVSELGRKHVFV
jgi:hypothetical protein